MPFLKRNYYSYPCQLPIHLLERIILMTTDEGDIVLDPFSGTGTTAIAAKRLRRNYIGFELNKEYVQTSNYKLDLEKSNSKIGDSWISFFKNDIVTLRNNDWEDILNYYILPDSKKEINHTKINFLDKKKILKYFEFISNGNGTKKPTEDQIKVKLDFCDCNDKTIEHHRIHST